MRAIIVMFDSLNRRYLPPYGCEWIHAPNFERLAGRTVTFDNCYIGSMPCMPARRELHTGRYNFLHRSWGPLEPFDDSMPQILAENGIYTHLVSDHYHYWEDGGATYHERYSSWEIARGQEGDPWKGEVAEPEILENIRQTKHGHWRQDWVNRKYLRREEDQPQAITFDLGLEFIHTNYQDQGWFLQIETFDPHEPFFTQDKYKSLYPHDYHGPHFDWPDYRRVIETDEQVEHVRYEYAALVSMCDHHLGRVLDVMDEYDMWDDTMLIVITDHGYLLGEHGWWAKNMMPWYNELAHLPFFVWDPRCQRCGERRISLVQMIDLAPTLLEFFGLEIPRDMQGLPLREVVACDKPVRGGGLFGIHGGHVSVTDGRYVYMRSCATPSNAPLYEYTLMPMHMNRRFGVAELQNVELVEPFSFTKGSRTMQIQASSFFSPYDYGALLFDLNADPRQKHPMIDNEIEHRMIALMVDLMAANDAPPEQYERLDLPGDGVVTDAHLQLEQGSALARAAVTRYDRHTKLGVLLSDERARDVLQHHVPELLVLPGFEMAKRLSLAQLSRFAGGVLSDQKLTEVEGELLLLVASDAVSGGITTETPSR